MGKKFISWRRVSTFKQHKSGLGLDAQAEIIRYFVERADGELVADYAECYTGTELSGCLELHKAIAHCKSICAVLIIAKSDRFRNTVEALQIYEQMGEGNIMFCDLPHTDKFTLTLFFALSEREALITSIRTKQALAAKKARGEKLGGQCAAYKKSMSERTIEQIEETNMKRGETKNRRTLEKRDTVAMLKILHNVFPNDTEGEPKKWNWRGITTKGEYKEKMYRLMQDYRDMDETKSIFRKWDFHIDAFKLQTKLCAYIQSIKRSVMYEVAS